jgi:DNA-binding NtrC family response regulator
VGGRRPRRADVRLICATNRNLAELAGAGAFRLDLYHRINDFVVHLRPLRERPEDLPLLIDFFLRKCSGELGSEFRLSEEAQAKLGAHSYPGNIRELEKAVRRACILCEDDLIKPGDLYLESELPEAGAPDLQGVRARLDGLRLARRAAVVPRLLDFLRSAGPRWFSSREWARAAGLSDSQARAQLKALSAGGGPLEHNGAARALSRYRLRAGFS